MQGLHTYDKSQPYPMLRAILGSPWVSAQRKGFALYPTSHGRTLVRCTLRLSWLKRRMLAKMAELGSHISVNASTHSSLQYKMTAMLRSSFLTVVLNDSPTAAPSWHIDDDTAFGYRRLH